MTGAPSKQPASIGPDRLVSRVCSRLADNKRVRRSLPVWGRIHIDRQLPFLCVYRRPSDREDPGTKRLVTSEASYLIARGSGRVQPGLRNMVRSVAQTLTEHFGACLVLEVWSARPEAGDGTDTLAGLCPGFRLVIPKGTDAASFIHQFQEALGRVKVARRQATVSVPPPARCCPPGMSPVLTADDLSAIGCHLFGLEVAPIYQDPSTGEVFPLVLQELRQGLTRALRHVFFAYAHTLTTHRPRHFHTLGSRTMVKAVWEVDRILAEVSDSFDILLLLTPVNGNEAWQRFQHSRFQKEPVFQYRPRPLDPAVLKRNLYRAPVERLDDPVMAQLFREKMDELDREITLLQDRNTPRFVHESTQLFGDVEQSLGRLAGKMLRKIPRRTRDESGTEYLDAHAFARLAREEIEFYRASSPEFGATVEVRPDVIGLLTSHGSLLVGSQSRIPASRADALIQHEVGTHVLTYHNGRSQRLRQLATGLAGYDSLQEGLAVLAEYLVGGMSRPRLRLLAARVVAARGMLDGATFVDTFRNLHRDHGFAGQTAFTVAVRTHRGGGLSKDAVYLRGLRQILRYLAGGGLIRPLFTGKIGADHVPIIIELQWRGILHEPPFIPRYLERPDVQRRLEMLREGLSVMDLVKKEKT
ncbi:MAG TPA: tyrosine/phenylalanine carboxypeptidase domain-containing protein [Myxococcota bacterium]|nr:tyrosine/phenylalanine carboxypeptidase domain-containing protein [Myxococcota bacterium]